MKGTWVMTEEDKVEKKRKAAERRLVKAQKDATKILQHGHVGHARRRQPSSPRSGPSSSAGCSDEYESRLHEAENNGAWVKMPPSYSPFAAYNKEEPDNSSCATSSSFDRASPTHLEESPKPQQQREQEPSGSGMELSGSRLEPSTSRVLPPPPPAQSPPPLSHLPMLAPLERDNFYSSLSAAKSPGHRPGDPAKHRGVFHSPPPPLPPPPVPVPNPMTSAAHFPLVGRRHSLSDRVPHHLPFQHHHPAAATTAALTYPVPVSPRNRSFGTPSGGSGPHLSSPYQSLTMPMLETRTKVAHHTPPFTPSPPDESTSNKRTAATIYAQEEASGSTDFFEEELRRRSEAVLGYPLERVAEAPAEQRPIRTEEREEIQFVEEIHTVEEKEKEMDEVEVVDDDAESGRGLLTPIDLSSPRGSVNSNAAPMSPCDSLSPEVIARSSPRSDSSTDSTIDVSFFLADTIVNEDLARNHLTVTFTQEEHRLVQSIMEKELASQKEIPISMRLVDNLINVVRTGGTMSHEDCMEGYTAALKRIIKFSSCLDFFNSFSNKDQRQLLLYNTDMIINVKAARLLQKDNLQKQGTHSIAHIFALILA